MFMPNSPSPPSGIAHNEEAAEDALKSGVFLGTADVIVSQRQQDRRSRVVGHSAEPSRGRRSFFRLARQSGLCTLVGRIRRDCRH